MALGASPTPPQPSPATITESKPALLGRRLAWISLACGFLSSGLIVVLFVVAAIGPIIVYLLSTLIFGLFVKLIYAGSVLAAITAVATGILALRRGPGRDVWPQAIAGLVLGVLGSAVLLVVYALMSVA